MPSFLRGKKWRELKRLGRSVNGILYYGAEVPQTPITSFVDFLQKAHMSRREVAARLGYKTDGSEWGNYPPKSVIAFLDAFMAWLRAEKQNAALVEEIARLKRELAAVNPLHGLE